MRGRGGRASVGVAADPARERKTPEYRTMDTDVTVPRLGLRADRLPWHIYESFIHTLFPSVSLRVFVCVAKVYSPVVGLKWFVYGICIM